MSRESHTLLLVHDAQYIYGSIGIHEPFQQPDVVRCMASHQVVEARVGQQADGTFVVGDALRDALASDAKLEIFYPIENGVVSNWDALEALWRHVLVERLGVQPAENAYYLMLALPSPVSRDVYERGAQLLFETFNTPALTISEVPLLAAYAVGVLTALVVDMGAEESSAVAVNDCIVVPTGIVVSKLGTVHCTYWLAHLLRQDTQVANALEPVAQGDLDAAAWALAQQLVADQLVLVDNESMQQVDEDDGVLDVAQALVDGRERMVVEAHEREKEAAAKQTQAGNHASDTILVSFRNADIPVPRVVRARFHEPLLAPALLERVTLSIPVPRAVQQALQARRLGGEPACLSFIDMVARAVAQVHPQERRVALWDSLVFTGATARVPGLSNELLRALSAHTVLELTEAGQVVGEPNPAQPQTVRAQRIPDYFGAFKERLDLAPFLGATIYAKLVFGDLSGRNYITKKQYNEGGPAVAFAIGSV